MRKYLPFIIFITFLAYLNSFGNGFVWDDLNTIVQNNVLRGPFGLREIFLNASSQQIFYRPIPYFTLWLDWFFWKENPTGYHFTNFAFHLACVILVFLLSERLIRSKKLSFISTLLFAVHPAHTEAVTYISGRAEPICGFFTFLSFWLYLNYLDSVSKKALYLGGALFSFLLALFSKEIALLFPLVILSYGLYFYRDSLPRPRAKFLGEHLLFLCLAIAYLLFRYFFVKLPAAMSLGKFYLFPKIFLFYLRLLVFPFNLHMQHSLKESDFFLQLSLLLSALIFSAIIFAAMRSIKERCLRFGLLWFFLWMLPFLGFFQFNADMAEHWLYISSFGFFLIAGSFMSKSNLLKHKFIVSSVIIFFCFLTSQRNLAWRDDISIYRDTLKYNYDDPKLHYNLGNAYLRRNLLKEAYEEYALALKQNPGCASALNNLGLVKEREKDFAGAYQFYQRAASINPRLKAAKKNLLRLEFISSAFASQGDDEFEHGLYGEVLAKFVKDGKVDYRALKNDPYLLDDYLRQVAELEREVFDGMASSEKIAFYINAYNAITLKVITDHYPAKSIKDIPGVWDRIKFKVAGKGLTLNQIEHGILRKEFKEPRIHFALVCASRGCPELPVEPLRGKILDEQLERQARKFINDKTKVMLDKSNRTLYLSSIFKWFNEDFGDVIKFISKYLPEKTAEFIEKAKPKTRYLNYDWSLNEKS